MKNKLSTLMVKQKVLVGLSVVALLAVACGSSTTVSSNSSNSASTSSVNESNLSESQIALYSGSNRQSVLVAGAKKEGQLSYWDIMTVSSDTKDLLAGFQKKYPFIKVKPFYGNPDALITNMKSAYSAGKYPVDVIELDNLSMAQITSGGYTQAFKSPNSTDLAPQMVQLNSAGNITYVSPVYYGFGVMWNTSLVPKGFTVNSWSSLLNPVLKGKIVMPTSFTSDMTAGEIASAESNQGSTFFHNLAGQQIHFVAGSANSISNMVAQGQYALSPGIYESYYLAAKAAGAPVAYSALPPQFVVTYSFALAAHAPDPYASMLFLDYVISTQGAKLVAANPGRHVSLQGQVPSGLVLPQNSNLAAEEKAWVSDVKILQAG